MLESIILFYIIQNKNLKHRETYIGISHGIAFFVIWKLPPFHWTDQKQLKPCIMIKILVFLISRRIFQRYYARIMNLNDWRLWKLVDWKNEMIHKTVDLLVYVLFINFTLVTCINMSYVPLHSWELLIFSPWLIYGDFFLKQFSKI